VIGLIEKELSEPYPVYTYRYFVHGWPEHTWLACLPDGRCVGCIVAKLEDHVKHYWRTRKLRGYIAMLAVHPDFRRLGLGRRLVRQSIERMKEQGADEIILETEITNQAALRLYECKNLDGQRMTLLL
jgi:peptide alpha-N-acetyltransferase